MSQLSHAQFPLRRHPDLLVDHRRARSAAVAEPRGANAESRDRLRWPASFRNGGRHQIGTAADIKSESPAGLRRNSHGGGRPEFEPLHFFGVSAKRYVLANRGSDREWIIRKASGHGLAHITAPHYQSGLPPHPAAPLDPETGEPIEGELCHG